MSELLLTDEERKRFTVWLRMQAESFNGTAKLLEEQMKGSPIKDEIVKRERQKAVACTIVANDIDSAEEMTL